MKNFEPWPADRTYGGQLYVCVGVEPHVRRDGSRSILARWQANCADCGEPFDFRTPLKARRFEPNRRCQKHKRPGQRVRP